MAHRGALVAATLLCMALGAFAGDYKAYYGKYPSSDYQTSYVAGKLPKGTAYTTMTYPTCPGKQVNNDLIYKISVCTFDGIVTGISYTTAQKGKEVTYDMCTVDAPEGGKDYYAGMYKAAEYYSDDYKPAYKKGYESKPKYMGADVAAAALPQEESPEHAVEDPEEVEEPEMQCQHLVLDYGAVITRTQVWRVLLDTEKGKEWFVSDVAFFLEGGKDSAEGNYVWGYGKDDYFKMSEEEYVIKMAMSNQVARKGSKKMVCGATGFFKPVCNDYGMLADLRTCGKCFKAEGAKGYAGYMAKDSKYYAPEAPSKYTKDEGYYFCSKDLKA